MSVPVSVAPVWVLGPFRELSWKQQAACARLPKAVFFPERGTSTSPAKTTCRDCAVQQACLEYALETEDRYGIWGGLSWPERRRLLSARAATHTA